MYIYKKKLLSVITEVLHKKKFPGATDLQWQRKRHIRVCQCVSVSVCVCSDPNIYGSSVIIMAFEKNSYFKSSHTQKLLSPVQKTNKQNILRTKRAAALQLYRDASRQDYNDTCARLQTLITPRLCCCCCCVSPRLPLPVSSPRLFPSGRVPAGPGQEGGHNALEPPPER